MQLHTEEQLWLWSHWPHSACKQWGPNS